MSLLEANAEIRLLALPGPRYPDVGKCRASVRSHPLLWLQALERDVTFRISLASARSSYSRASNSNRVIACETERRCDFYPPLSLVGENNNVGSSSRNKRQIYYVKYKYMYVRFTSIHQISFINTYLLEWLQMRYTYICTSKKIKITKHLFRKT